MGDKRAPKGAPKAGNLLSEFRYFLTSSELQDVELDVVYRNTKTTDEYILLDIGLNTETEEMMAVYKKAEQGWRGRRYPKGTGQTFIRPLSMFAGKRVDGRWYFERAE